MLKDGGARGRSMKVQSTGTWSFEDIYNPKYRSTYNLLRGTEGADKYN